MRYINALPLPLPNCLSPNLFSYLLAYILANFVNIN